MEMLKLFCPILLVFLVWACQENTDEIETPEPRPFEPQVCPSYGFEHRDFCTELHAKSGGVAANAWGKTDDIWKQDEIKITFFGGSTEVHQKVMFYMRELEEHANIKLNFGSFDNADVRISFGCNGHWSYVGNQALSIPQHQATMNLSITANTDPFEIQRVALHEGGHMLGLQHEHQSPVGDIQWNEQLVLDYYRRTQGWDEVQTRNNLLNRYTGTRFNATEFDRYSIMLYPIPEELTSNVFSSGWNWKLSNKDKEWLRTNYP